MPSLPVKLPDRAFPRILVVDGEPTVSAVLSVCMRSLGYKVRRARSRGATAEAIRNWTPDLLITSIRTSRTAACRLFGNVRRGVQIPILLVCANEDQRVAVQNCWMSADHCVVRPFSISQILDRILVMTQRMSTHS